VRRQHPICVRSPQRTNLGQGLDHDVRHERAVFLEEGLLPQDLDEGLDTDVVRVSEATIVRQ
jgi:hypothetical protein